MNWYSLNPLGDIVSASNVPQVSTMVPELFLMFIIMVPTGFPTALSSLVEGRPRRRQRFRSVSPPLARLERQDTGGGRDPSPEA